MKKADSYVAKTLLTHKALTKEEEYVLIAKAQKGCIKSRDELLMANMRFIYTYCARWSEIKDTVEPEDLLADGIEGFLKSINKFDLTKNTKLQSYSGYWIMNSISRSNLFDDPIRLPTHQKDNLRNINIARVKLLKEGVSEPTEQQLSERSGVSIRHLSQIRDYLNNSRYISINYVYEDPDVRNATPLEDIIPDPNVPLLQEQTDVNIDLIYLLDLLPPMHKYVLSRSYGIPEKMTLEAIGKHFNKSREYMRLIRNTALEALQEHVRLCDEDDLYASRDHKQNVALLIKNHNREISNKSTEYKRQLRLRSQHL